MLELTTGQNATFDLAESPKVTVVIPAYNAELYLGETIESALSQTYKNFEVVVVDDGSTDRTRQIGLTFAAKDARLRIVSGPNGGVARARNVGTELADGKYVAYLDADDLWHETKLAEQVRILEAASDTSWAACYALFLIIDSSGFVIRPGPTRRAEGYILARHLFAKFVGNGSSLLVRRDAALAVGGFDPSYADAGIGGCEDFDFELRLAARYRIAVAPEYLIGYRSYPGNMSSNAERMSRSLIETLDRHIARNPGLPKRVRGLALGSAHRWAARILLRSGNWSAGLQHPIELVRNDPAMILRIASESISPVARQVWRALRKALRLRPHPIARHFSEMPTATKSAKEFGYFERRLRYLEAVDREMELALLDRSATDMSRSNERSE